MDLEFNNIDIAPTQWTPITEPTANISTQGFSFTSFLIGAHWLLTSFVIPAIIISGLTTIVSGINTYRTTEVGLDSLEDSIEDALQKDIFSKILKDIDLHLEADALIDYFTRTSIGILTGFFILLRLAVNLPKNYDFLTAICDKVFCQTELQNNEENTPLVEDAREFTYPLYKKPSPGRVHYALLTGAMTIEWLLALTTWKNILFRDEQDVNYSDFILVGLLGVTNAINFAAIQYFQRGSQYDQLDLYQQHMQAKYTDSTQRHKKLLWNAVKRQLIVNGGLISSVVADFTTLQLYLGEVFLGNEVALIGAVLIFATKFPNFHDKGYGYQFLNEGGSVVRLTTPMHDEEAALIINAVVDHLPEAQRVSFLRKIRNFCTPENFPHFLESFRKLALTEVSVLTLIKTSISMFYQVQNATGLLLLSLPAGLVAGIISVLNTRILMTDLEKVPLNRQLEPAKGSLTDTAFGLFAMKDVKPLICGEERPEIVVDTTPNLT